MRSKKKKTKVKVRKSWGTTNPVTKIEKDRTKYSRKNWEQKERERHFYSDL